jgi:hypothetical protein
MLARDYRWPVVAFAWNPPKVYQRHRSPIGAAPLAGRTSHHPEPSAEARAGLTTLWSRLAPLLMLPVVVAACGPHANLPPRPLSVPGALGPQDSAWVLAGQLAPTLYLQRDESFPLDRVVAVVHPSVPIVAYHLLWRDDVAGAWIPFTKPTDEEIVWVGYDSTGAPTDLWTYWHGDVLHADWRGKGQPEVDVQWGKHGSLPHNVVRSSLPALRTMNFFYDLSWALPDLWLGRLSRPGPLCFCHSFKRYLEFTRPIFVGARIDAVVRTSTPDSALASVFGRPYSQKAAWPWEISHQTK